MKNLTAKVYASIVEDAAALYPTGNDIQALLVKTQIPREHIKLEGTGLNMWDSVVSYAEKNGQLPGLLNTMLEEYPAGGGLKTILGSINEGSAFVKTFSIKSWLQPPVTDATARVMLVYDAEDKGLCKGLKAQLTPLRLDGSITFLKDMHDTTGGVNTEEERIKNLLAADVILLLLSQNFMGSDTCLEMAFTAHENKKQPVPVLLSPCLWARIKIFENIQPLPKDGRPVTQWPDDDEALLEIAKGVEEVVTKRHP